jgi:hypothetical protein
MKWVNEEFKPWRIEVMISSSGMGFLAALSWSARCLADCR